MQRCSTSYIYRHDQQSYAEVLRHLPRLIAPATVTLECAVVVLGRVRVLQWFTGPWRIVRLRDSTRRLLWGSTRGWHGAVLTTHRNWSKLRNSLFHIVYKTCRCKYTRNYDTPNRSVLIETFEYVTSFCMWWILMVGHMSFSYSFNTMTWLNFQYISFNLYFSLMNLQSNK